MTMRRAWMAAVVGATAAAIASGGGCAGKRAVEPGAPPVAHGSIDWVRYTTIYDAIRRDDLELVRAHLRAGVDANAAPRAKWATPLAMAAHHGRVEIARVLLEAGAEPGKSSGPYDRTPLEAATVFGHAAVARLLIEHGAKPTLEQAVRLDDPAQVKRIVGERPDAMKWRGDDGQTPLGLAASLGSAGAAAALLELGASPNERAEYGMPPLYIACLHDRVAVARRLIDGGADPMLDWHVKWSCLRIAAERGHHALLRSIRPGDDRPDLWIDAALGDERRVAEAIEAAGGSVRDAVFGDGQRPLAWAARFGHLAVMDRLLAAGAPVNAADDEGVTPLMRAAEGGHVESVRRLIRAGADAKHGIGSEAGTALHAAAIADRADAVYELVEAGAPVDAADKWGNTPLTKAIAARSSDAVFALLKAGATPRRTGDKGPSPMLAAAMADDAPMIDALARAGVDLDERDGDGVTPLMRAAEGVRVAAVAKLIELGANAQAIDRQHRTTMHYAQSASDRSDPGEVAAIVRMLADAGADVNRPERGWGYRPLHYAVLRDELRVYQLVQLGALVDGAMDRLWTPLHQAAQVGRVNTVRLLLDLGADPGARAVGGSTAIDIAGERPDNGEVIALLRKRGTPIDIRSAVRMGDLAEFERLLAEDPGRVRTTSAGNATLLHLAAGEGHAAIVDRLIALGLDPSAPNRINWTPLTGAVYHQRADAVRRLVEAGSDVNVVDVNGKTPLDWAYDAPVQRRNAEIVRVLTEAGGEERKPSSTRAEELKKQRETDGVAKPRE